MKSTVVRVGLVIGVVSILLSSLGCAPPGARFEGVYVAVQPDEPYTFNMVNSIEFRDGKVTFELLGFAMPPLDYVVRGNKAIVKSEDLGEVVFTRVNATTLKCEVAGEEATYKKQR